MMWRQPLSDRAPGTAAFKWCRARTGPGLIGRLAVPDGRSVWVSPAAMWRLQVPDRAQLGCGDTTQCGDTHVTFYT